MAAFRLRSAIGAVVTVLLAAAVNPVTAATPRPRPAPAAKSAKPVTTSAPTPPAPRADDRFPVLTNLCKFVKCSVQYVGPHIDSVTSWALIMPGGSHVTPGALVIVKGQNFGSNQGSLRLAGLTHFAPVLWDNSFVAVDVQAWHDTVIIGTIPHDQKIGPAKDQVDYRLDDGLMDQPATMYVARQGDGKESNKYPVSFVAVKDFQILPGCDVTIVTCGTDADYDACNGTHDPDDSVPWYMGTGGCEVMMTSTLGGYHQDNFCCQFSADESNDGYKATLKNGWAFDSWNFSAWTSDKSDSEIKAFVAGDNLVSGSNTWDTQYIHWATNANDWVAYSASVFIHGPKGVPWK